MRYVRIASSGGDISAYGFGDSTTRDLDVFSFNADEAPCRGPEVLLARYEELAASGQVCSITPAVFPGFRRVFGCRRDLANILMTEFPGQYRTPGHNEFLSTGLVNSADGTEFSEVVCAAYSPRS